MKRTFKLSGLILLLCLAQAGPVSSKKHKQARVSPASAMISASASMGQIQNSLAEEDYFAAAEKFMQLARAFKSIEHTRPPKGSKEDWDAMHQAIINLAFKAIGTCADEDTAKARAYVQQIVNYMQAGHTMFR